jgi:RNA polymerase sigma-70 factor (ECF subfamily)
MRIAYNVFYDYRRKEQPHPQPLPHGEGLEVGLGVGLRMDLYAALALLKPDERTCITLQLIDGYDIAAIARITGMKAGTVKSHLSRGKEKMANYLRQNGYDGR